MKVSKYIYEMQTKGFSNKRYCESPAIFAFDIVELCTSSPTLYI